MDGYLPTRRRTGYIYPKTDEPPTAVFIYMPFPKSTPHVSFLPQTSDRRFPSTLHASRNGPRSTGQPMEGHLHSSNAAGLPPRPFGYPIMTEDVSCSGWKLRAGTVITHWPNFALLDPQRKPRSTARQLIVWPLMADFSNLLASLVTNYPLTSS